MAELISLRKRWIDEIIRLAKCRKLTKSHLDRIYGEIEKIDRQLRKCR